jgi:aspartate carbamoyltransferase catalytic subunit
MQFNSNKLLNLFELADKIRKIAKTKDGLDFLQTILSHKRAVLYFAQPSTRTYLSFNNACQILGIKTSEMRSVELSSEVKGESVEDTLETIHSYTDMLIIRHRDEKLASKAAWMFNKSDKPIPVINAGSGPFEHPTQALLDIYTIYRAFNGKIKNKVISIIGDLKRGRAVRSFIYLIKNFSGIKLNFISPQELKITEDIKKYLLINNINFEESDDLNKYIKKTDIFYYTRIQDEYDKQMESQNIDYSKLYFKAKYLNLIKEKSIILHPLPRRNEIPPEIDKDKRALYWKQEINGLWIRTALIAHIFKEDGYILNYK